MEKDTHDRDKTNWYFIFYNAFNANKTDHKILDTVWMMCKSIQTKTIYMYHKVMYLFFFNYGLNITVYIYPAEIFFLH